MYGPAEKGFDKQPRRNWQCQSTIQIGIARSALEVETTADLQSGEKVGPVSRQPEIQPGRQERCSEIENVGMGFITSLRVDRWTEAHFK